MTEEHLPSKFAFILHADVAGSTELVRQNEHIAHKRIQDTFRRFSDIITKYHGQVREVRGDALLAEYERASDAVTAALSFQADQTDFLTQLDDTIQPKVRVGIAMGEVIVADETLTGAGVVLAQRMEQLAEPGGVCITGAIHEALPPRLPFDQSDLGEQQIKGFDEPVRVYTVGLKEGADLPKPTVVSEPKKSKVGQFTLVAGVVVLICGGGLLAWLQPWKPDIEPASQTKMVLPLPDKPSIAVLPFDNLTGDPSKNYLSDGFSENIITELSRFPQFFVIARQSSFSYKDKPVTVQQVSEELGVRYVLEGSVQLAGDRVRVTTQLINAIEGDHVWAERYDRKLEDIFAVQDEITRTIVATLKSNIDLSEYERVKNKPPTSLSAYESWALGGAHWFKYTAEDNERARELFEQARELDPEYAEAYRGLTWVNINGYRWGWSGSLSRERSLELALEMARKGVELAPFNHRLHQAMAAALLQAGKLEEALAAFDRAIELNPNDASVLASISEPLIYTGQAAQAVVQIERAIRLNPYHPVWYLWNLGFAQYYAGDYEKSVESFMRMKKMPNLARRQLAASYVRLGQIDKAKEVMTEFLKNDPDYSIQKLRLNFKGKFTNSEDLERFIDDVRTAGLPESPPLKLPDKPSIAVLPFTNMSNDAEQEYFVDGMTEDLITDLSKLSGLFVIARNSSFAYKDKIVDVKNVARELGVRYVMEGSVRRAGNQVRINTQLIDAITGGHLWAERYDGVISNVFALQDEITSKIVTAMAVQLTSKEKTEQALRQTDNPEAYEALLKGLEHYRRDTVDHYAKAMEYFEQATGLDPEYSRAYAAMASIYWRSFIDEFYQAFQIDRTTARERAQEFLELAMRRPTSLAYQASSDINLWWHRYDEAIRDGEKAIDFDPNNAGGLIVLAKALIFSGQPQGAFDLMDKAEHLDPIGKAYYEFVRGLAYFGMDQFDEAAAALERARELNPEDWAASDPENECRPCQVLLSTYGHLGHTEEAQLVFAYIKSYWDRFNIEDTPQYWPYKQDIDAERLKKGLRKASVPEFGGQ